jgi:VIT1/CCC1 family predicted Fe2+/Mn2+ transporter
MFDKPLPTSKRVLEPYDRISEVLFGLIMVLTITCAVSAVHAGRAEIRTMLLSALGCNLAWGIIDAFFYLMACLAERSQNLITLKAVRRTTDSQHAHRLIASALHPLIASILQPAELDMIHQRLNQLPEPPARVRLGRREYWGAVGVFLLVFVSTLPVVAPFIFMQNAHLALRVSNLIAVMMLFLLGCAFGRSTERSPLMSGIIMVFIGVVLVGLCEVFGG